MSHPPPALLAIPRVPMSPPMLLPITLLLPPSHPQLTHHPAVLLPCVQGLVDWCTALDPDARPTFKHILDRLKGATATPPTPLTAAP